MSVMTTDDYTPEMQWAAAQVPQPTTPRWSHHLQNNPFKSQDAANYAKRYYDNPNVDPNALIQRDVSAFRSQYGNDAPQDDESVLAMLGTGQTPQPKQTPIQSWSQPQTQMNVQQSAENKARGDEVWGKLASLVNQSTDVTKSPVVQAQTDAFAAQQRQAQRRLINDLAERYGPLTNMQAEERMASDRAGQATGAFQANAMGQELMALRAQIMQALEMQSGFLSDDRRTALQEKVSEIDAMLKQQGLNLDWTRTNMNQDLALRQLGLQDWDRQMYYDLIQRGLL